MVKYTCRLIVSSPLALLNLSELLIWCVLYFIFIGNYSETLNDAKVAIELQPHFLKAFVKGKS